MIMNIRYVLPGEFGIDSWRHEILISFSRKVSEIFCVFYRNFQTLLVLKIVVDFGVSVCLFLPFYNELIIINNKFYNKNFCFIGQNEVWLRYFTYYISVRGLKSRKSADVNTVLQLKTSHIQQR